jgi:hypothetical protein
MGCASPRRNLPGLAPGGEARAPPPHHAKTGRAGDPGASPYAILDAGVALVFRTPVRATDFQRTIYTGLQAVLQIFSMILAVRSGAIIRSNIGSWGAP